MELRFGLVIGSLGTLAVVTAIWLVVELGTGQAPAPAPPGLLTVDRLPPYEASRTPDQRPDLNGIWQAVVTANWDIQDHDAAAGPFSELMGAYGARPAGQGIVEGNEIPYQEWAVARKQENFENRLVADFSQYLAEPERGLEAWHATGDPEAKCYMPGIPRAMYMPHPFQIVQTPEFILMTYEFTTAHRIVRMDWEQTSPIDSWMGWPRGHWEGDTLVIDSEGYNAYTWFDRAGNFHSEAMRVVERITPVTPYHLMYEATIEDPNVFTRPWTMRFPLYRRMEENVQLLEFKCVPFTEEFMYERFSAPADN